MTRQGRLSPLLPVYLWTRDLMEDLKGDFKERIAGHGQALETDAQQEKKLRVLLLSDRYETRHRLFNLGDRALLDGIHRLLEDKPGIELRSGPWKSFPYYTIGHLGKGSDVAQVTETFERWAGEARNYRPRRARFESAVVHALNNWPLFNNPLRRAIDRWVERRYSLGLIEAAIPYLFRHHCASIVVEEIAAADVVVFNGTGLISDHLAQYMPGHLLEVFLALQMNKRVVTVNQTVHLTRSELIQMVRVLYKSTDMNLVREPLSSEHLIQMGVSPERVVVSGDSAFAIPESAVPEMLEAAQREGIDEQTVLLTVRGDRCTDVDIDAWAALVDHVQQTLKRKVVWVHTAPPQDDAIARALHDRCGIHIAHRDYGYLEVIGLMKHAGLVLTDRYHACIFAIIAGCPVLPFESNTWKIRGLFKFFEYPLAVQPVLTRETLNDAVESVGTALQLSGTCREYAAGIHTQMLARCHRDIAKVWEVVPGDYAL